MNKTTRPRDYKTTRRERRQRGREQPPACKATACRGEHRTALAGRRKSSFCRDAQTNTRGPSRTRRCVRATHLTTQDALSLHTVECLLKNLLVGGAAEFFASGIDPLFLERVLCGTIGFVEDAEDAGERELRQFVGGELVGDVVTEFVLGSVVPFLFLDQLEAAAFARIGRIEGAGIKFDAFTQTFDGGEAGMIHRALNHLDHVIDLRGVGAGDEGGPGADQLFHRIDRHVDRTSRVGLAFETDGRGGRGLLFGQAIDEVVHDEINHVDVLARAVIEMVAADGETVTIAAEQKDMEIGPGQTDASRERDGAAVNEVGAVAVDEIRKTRRATDPGKGDDLFVLELAFLEDLVEGRQNREVAAAGAPGGMVGGNSFLG